MSQKFRPTSVLFFLACHILAFYGLFQIDSVRIVASVIALVFLSNLGITVGSHRLWSHRSYKAKTPLKIFLMILTSLSNEGSIYHWSRDHIVHHKYSDQKADPHNIKNGLFYAHIGWLFYDKHQLTIQAGKELNLEYLDRDWVVTFQKKFYIYFAITFCYFLPTLYGVYVHKLTPFTSFCIFGMFRWIINLHCTWCVNSVAHQYGYRPYDKNSPTTESWFTNIVSIGEGSHNWHHKYPYDYAASEFDMFKTGKVFNPSKTFIDIMYYCGQAYDLKRYDFTNKKLIRY